jgi:heme/copper-type cytochrome/quinol oxidase subunit 3
MSDPSRGMQSLAEPAPEYAPEVDARLARVGMRIFLGADVFFFAAFFFAFFYLRAMDNDKSWLPAGQIPNPSATIGGMIVLLVVVCAALYAVSARSAANAHSMTKGILWWAFLAGVVAVALQVYEFRHLGFDPQLGGGYSSVFVGLKSVWLAQVIGVVVWLGTYIAQAGPTGDTTARPVSAAIFGNFLMFLAGVGLVAFVVLYFF